MRAEVAPALTEPIGAGVAQHPPDSLWDLLARAVQHILFHLRCWGHLSFCRVSVSGLGGGRGCKEQKSSCDLLGGTGRGAGTRLGTPRHRKRGCAGGESRRQQFGWARPGTCTLWACSSQGWAGIWGQALGLVWCLVTLKTLHAQSPNSSGCS